MTVLIPPLRPIASMVSASKAESGAVNRGLFVLTLWVALATALICALWPSGLPLTKTIGSAFNPSTTAVALRGKSEPLRVTVKCVMKPQGNRTIGSVPVAYAQPIATSSLAISPRTPREEAIRPILSFQPLQPTSAKPYCSRGPPIP